MTLPKSPLYKWMHHPEVWVQALIQEGKPIAFASKSLTETEQRYCQYWTGALGSRNLAVNIFERIFYNCSFEVEDDHKPLGMICLKNLTAAPPRLQRMLLRLQEYDMVIKYRPGSEMLLADGLSRLPRKKNKEVIDLDIKVDFVQFSTEKLTQIRQATNADSTLCELKVRILKGWPESRRELHKDLQPYWSYRDELSIENGVLLKRWQDSDPQFNATRSFGEITWWSPRKWQV